MLAKLIVEAGLVEQAISNGLPNTSFQLELEAGDNFSDLKYRMRYDYDVSQYVGPVSEEQARVFLCLLHTEIGSLLDIGSGSGYIAEWFARSGFDVTACEIDPFAAHICRARGIEKVVEHEPLRLHAHEVMRFSVHDVPR